MKTNYVKYLFSFVLALWASALSAQTHWTVNDNFSSYMTIYFDLTLGDEAVASEKRSNYEVVAMIDDDCRGRGEFITVSGHTYGQMMVYGDAADDGKQLTFMVYDRTEKEEKHIYGVNVKFSVDGMVGYPSQPQAFDVNFNYLLGDANGDGKVSIADAVAIVDFILSDGATELVQAAADMNKDGKISISDAVDVVDMILNN
jgi:hypothetical protein